MLVVKVGEGEEMVCADVIGAGMGERVLVTTGAAARLAIGEKEAGVDAAVVAIVDDLERAKQEDGGK